MRKTKEVRIAEAGRDQGKVFKITEMPAAQAEKWGMRVLLLAAASGADVPQVMTGMRGVAIAGVQAVVGGVDFAQAEPLLDEMMRCISVLPSADNHRPEMAALERPMQDDDTEEIGTRIKLRAEVIALHTGFSSADEFWAYLKEQQAQSPPA